MTQTELFWSMIDAERDVLWRLARGLTSSYDDADDLMSETILAAFKSFPALRDHVAFRKFLSTIAIRLHKRRLWRNRIFLPLADGSDVVYENYRESSYDLELLLALLGRLPNRQRETLILFEISELSLKEIQEVQGGTLSGVKSRLVRARHNLRALLADEGLQLDEKTMAVAGSRFRLQQT